MAKPIPVPAISSLLCNLLKSSNILSEYSGEKPMPLSVKVNLWKILLAVKVTFPTFSKDAFRNLF